MLGGSHHIWRMTELRRVALVVVLSSWLIALPALRQLRNLPLPSQQRKKMTATVWSWRIIPCLLQAPQQRRRRHSQDSAVVYAAEWSTSSARGHLTRTRTMKRMVDKSISESARKKASKVRTALANNVETYVSIVKDMMPAAGSQDVLDICLTQASLEVKK